MPLAHVANTLDPNDFIIVPHIAVLDEFDMTDDDGKVIARIDANYIAKTVEHMNGRESATFDLCPGVIGHTKDEKDSAGNPIPVQGDEEVNGPPLVAYARNWVQDAFFDTGKTAAFVDFWIYKEDVNRVKKFPRRSCEVHINRHEIDPISFLGATTPARDLGLMVIKLSREQLKSGSITIPAPVDGGLFDRQTVRLSRTPTNRESDMPEEKKDDKKPARTDKPAGEESQTGSYKELCGKIDALTAMVNDMQAKANPPAADAEKQAATAAGGAGDAGGMGGEDQPLSDDELQQLLAQYDSAGGGEGDKSEGKEPLPAGAKEDKDSDKSRKGEEVEKMARDEQRDEELRNVKTRLARYEVKGMLADAVRLQNADIDPDDEVLITELMALPPDLQKSMVVRLSRHKSKSGSNASGHAGAAHLSAGASGGKRIETKEQQETVIKLARKKAISFDQAKEELGYA